MSLFPSVWWEGKKIKTKERYRYNLGDENGKERDDLFLSVFGMHLLPKSPILAKIKIGVLYRYKNSFPQSSASPFLSYQTSIPKSFHQSYFFSLFPLFPPTKQALIKVDSEKGVACD